MRGRWKVLAGVLAVLLGLLAINAIVTDSETKSAEVTVAGGEILRLTGGDIQAVDRGRAGGSPIVLLHCYTCAIDWWSGVMPRLERGHRVVALDLLGHGGSEKPSSGYSIEAQADVVAEALARLDVEDATVVGHSLGGAVAIALAERSPELVRRLVIIDSPPRPEEGDFGLLDRIASAPVIGQAAWRLKPDFAVRRGLEVAFVPGFDVPDAFVADLKRMNYAAYRDSPGAYEDYVEERSLDRRAAATGKELMVMMGEDDQLIDDPQAALDAYGESAPTSFGSLIHGVGHSPNVEEPVLTAKLINGFAAPPQAVRELRGGAANRGRVQDPVQDREAVRGAP